MSRRRSTWSWLMVLAISIAGAMNPSLVRASSDESNFEAKLRSQLDRIFYPEQYILDLQYNQAAGDSKQRVESEKEPLPGLAITSDPGQPTVMDKDGSSFRVSAGSGKTTVDVLFVADVSVSKDRVKIAEELIRRVAQTAGLQDRFRLQTRQQAVVKVALPVATPTVAPDKQDKGKDPLASGKSWIELIQENRSFAMWLLFISWAVIVSLIAVFGIVKRFSAQSNTSSSSRSRESWPQSGAMPSLGQSANHGGESRVSKAATKEELYSKDEALLKLSQDIVTEARTNPKKVAKIISRWVDLSEENAYYAAIFLKNCDIKTIEAVCGLLHPSDIETVMKQKVESFDPFSGENTRVLELMRGELALLAAQASIREKPDPLDFTKILSEEDLTSILAGEPIESVALAVTQIPAHRLSGYFSALDEDTLRALVRQIAHVSAPQAQDFDTLRERLQRKAEVLEASLLSEPERIQTLAQTILVIPNPRRQMALADELWSVNRHTFKEVHKRILLPGDLNHLSPRGIKVLIQSVDAETMGQALAGLRADFRTLMTSLPEAYSEIFMDTIKRGPVAGIQEKAWSKINDAVSDLVNSGLLSTQELAAARDAADHLRQTAGTETQAQELRHAS